MLFMSPPHEISPSAFCIMCINLKEPYPSLKFCKRTQFFFSLFFYVKISFFGLSAFVVLKSILRYSCAQSHFKFRKNLPNWNVVVYDKVCFPLFLQKMTEDQRCPWDDSSGTNNNCKCYQS